MHKIRKFIHSSISVLRQLKSKTLVYSYYANKVLIYWLNGSFKLIAYTKKHPIYTSIFEDNPLEGYLFYFYKPDNHTEYLLRFLIKNTEIFHLDAASAASFDEKNKKLIIECEGETFHSYLNDR